MSKEVNNQAVSFDIWKTLIKSNPDYKPTRDEYIANTLDLETGIIKTALRQADINCDETSDKTGVQFGPVERLESMCVTLGIPLGRSALSAIAHEVQELFLQYPLRLMEPELLETLDNIQANRAIALTSNTGFIDGVYMREALRNIGIMDRTNHQIFSNEIGVAKPNAKIFARTAELLGVTPSSITHVGDNFAADYIGATRAGMQAVYLTDENREDEVVATKTIKEAHDKGLL